MPPTTALIILGGIGLPVAALLKVAQLQRQGCREYSHIPAQIIAPYLITGLCAALVILFISAFGLGGLVAVILAITAVEYWRARSRPSGP